MEANKEICAELMRWRRLKPTLLESEAHDEDGVVVATERWINGMLGLEMGSATTRTLRFLC